eukprot:TRINITY_DN2630_c0_g3_i1.p1 TRINITY_DN2630_c0_g3~~TRINITY_DN2630_c0_g3_i1.p1  ORF type:complete len:372 (+),score=33.60 TRINITY_DN2630_c0_g3_i1:49-1164(+)
MITSSAVRRTPLFTSSAATATQKRFKNGAKRSTQKSNRRGTTVNTLNIPKWTYSTDMKIRSNEWKRRGLRNHFPEVWLRNTDWVESLESYKVDPEYHWQYYLQAHRQRLYNHPDDYSGFIDDMLEHVELRPKVWVPRMLRVWEDLKERYGASQRQYTTLIQLYGRARILSKAEEAFSEIGLKKMPYNKTNYLALSRAYILSRHLIGEEEAVKRVKHLFDEATQKGILLPVYITNITFERYYESLLKLGSELDYMTRKKDHDEGNGPMQRKAWDNRSVWHNIKPNPHIPREWSLYGHPLNRAEFLYDDFKGVKAGEPFYHQKWDKYGYPAQIRWIEKWRQFRKDGNWKAWEAKNWIATQRPDFKGIEVLDEK